MSVFQILIQYKQAFLDGLWVTVQLCLVVWAVGILVGSLLGWTGNRFKIAVGIPSKFLSFGLSGIPILVFLFWMHYPLQAILDIVVDPFYTASLTLSIVNIFAVADLVRTSLNDFPAQYAVAARVCGMSATQTMRHIQFPIVLRQILPGIVILQVNVLQATLFASLISVEEIFRVAQRINAIVYSPVEIYSALAVFFLLVCAPLNGLAYWLKTHFTRDLSER